MSYTLKILTAGFLLFSANAFAWPGTVTVKCQSLPQSKTKVALLVSMTGTPTPDYPAEVDLSIDDQKIKLDDPIRTAIAIIARPEDKVITAAYNERSESRIVDLTLWSKPDTIKGSRGADCREDYQFRAGFGGSIFLPSNLKGASAYDDMLDCSFHSSPGSGGC